MQLVRDSSCRAWSRWIALAAGAALAAAAVAAPPSVATLSDDAEVAVDGDLERFLLREGSMVEGLVGVVEARGPRYVFIAREDNRRFTLLENLALQRMLQASEDWLDTPTWRVDGTVTEFRDENFLLVKSLLLAE